MFYLSSWIEENRGTYVSLLRGLGKIPNSWNRWIEFFLRGVDEQARRNAEKAKSIMDLYERMKRKIIEITRSQFAVPLLDQMFERPLFQSTHLLFQGLSISRPSVATLLAALKEAGILSVIRQGAGRRPTVYVFPELLNLCEGRNLF
jgi:Fic family protein